MSATHKSSGAAAGAQIDTVLGRIREGRRSGIDRSGAIRRQAIEATRSRTANSSAPGRRALDAARSRVPAVGQVQHDLLEVAVERGRVVSRLAAENVESVSKTIAGVTAVFETLAGYATAAQKQAVEFAAAQSSTAYDAAKQQFEASGSAAAETFQRGVDTLLETQRTVLGAADAA